MVAVFLPLTLDILISQDGEYFTEFEVLKNPYIWMLALSSAFMYIARYSVTSWGPYFFEAEKGYSITEANSLIAISSVFGIFGTALSGIASDKLFRGRRNKPALIFGVLNVLSLSLFLLSPGLCGKSDQL